MTERDDDDTPNARDDNARHPIEHMARAALGVGADFFRAFKDANSGDPRREARGLIEMMVLNIREGEMPGRDFQGLPVHLPDTEREMRLLALSKVPADQGIKGELLGWARANRDHQDKAAKALEVAVAAYRRADTILADESCTDEELGDWVGIIRNHIIAVWKVDIRMAPMETAAIAAWSREAVARFNITPDWLGESGKPDSTFDPAAHRERPRGGAARNPFPSSFKARGGDDD